MAVRGRPRRYATYAAKIRAYRQRKKERQRLEALASHMSCRQIGPCTVYCCDWQEIYDHLPRHAAVISDPPYDAKYDVTKARRRPSRWTENFVGSDQPFDPTPWLQFPEVILFGADHYADTLPQTGTWWCWHKTPGQDSADFAPCEWIWVSMGRRPQYFDHLWRGGMRAGEENYSNLQKKLHPAQKPVALLTALVKETAAPVVMDPFMGSGTTLAACVRLGRPCIGIELDPAYFAVACQRLEHEVEAAQPRQGHDSEIIPP